MKKVIYSLIIINLWATAHEQQKQITAVRQATARQLVHQAARTSVYDSNVIGSEQDLQTNLSATQPQKKALTAITAEMREQLELNLQAAREKQNNALRALRKDKTNKDLKIASRNAMNEYHRAYRAIPEHRAMENDLQNNKYTQNREQKNAYQRAYYAQQKQKNALQQIAARHFKSKALEDAYKKRDFACNALKNNKDDEELKAAAKNAQKEYRRLRENAMRRARRTAHPEKYYHYDREYSAAYRKRRKEIMSNKLTTAQLNELRKFTETAPIQATAQNTDNQSSAQAWLEIVDYDLFEEALQKAQLQQSEEGNIFEGIDFDTLQQELNPEFFDEAE